MLQQKRLVLLAVQFLVKFLNWSAHLLEPKLRLVDVALELDVYVLNSARNLLHWVQLLNLVDDVVDPAHQGTNLLALLEILRFKLRILLDKLDRVIFQLPNLLHRLWIRYFVNQHNHAPGVGSHLFPPRHLQVITSEDWTADDFFGGLLPLSVVGIIYLLYVPVVL